MELSSSNCVWLKLWYDVFFVTVFFAEQFKGKIPVPPIQELFELEPNVLSKRWDKISLILSLQSWGRLIKAFLLTLDMIVGNRRG